MKKVRDEIVRKIPLAMYLEGLFNINKTIKSIKNINAWCKNDSQSDFIPLRYWKDFVSCAKKYIWIDSKCYKVMDETRKSHISIIVEKFDFKTISSSEPILLCVINNDNSRIREFVNYYKNLGIKYFAFIDNDSSDGTREYLEQLDNVNVYLTTDKYTTDRREGWINRLLYYIGYNHWVLCVDSDELFDYIGSETHDIHEYIRNLNKKRAFALMVDMYANKNVFDNRNTDQDYFSKYNFFDLDTYFISSSYRLELIHGGPRKRVFSEESKVFNCTLTKYPLFFFEKGYFQSCSHYSLPYAENYSDKIDCVLKHYKFMNNDMEKYIERANSGNYASGSLEYKTYVERLNSGKGLNFMFSNSKEYINSASLSLIKVNGKSIHDYFR